MISMKPLWKNIWQLSGNPLRFTSMPHSLQLIMAVAVAPDALGVAVGREVGTTGAWPPNCSSPTRP